MTYCSRSRASRTSTSSVTDFTRSVCSDGFCRRQDVLMSGSALSTSDAFCSGLQSEEERTYRESITCGGPEGIEKDNAVG